MLAVLQGTLSRSLRSANERKISRLGDVEIIFPRHTAEGIKISLRLRLIARSGEDSGLVPEVCNSLLTMLFSVISVTVISV
jgi:hypothetical protein